MSNPTIPATPSSKPMIGVDVEIMPTGEIRLIKTRVPWSLEGIVVERQGVQ